MREHDEGRDRADGPVGGEDDLSRGAAPGRGGGDTGAPGSDGEDVDAGDPVRALQTVYSDREPPPELEERVVEDYRARELAGARTRLGAAGWRSDGGARTSWKRVAAAIAVFAAGLAVGTLVPTGGEARSAASAPGMPSFMMLLWEGESFTPEADPAAAAESYGAWARSVARTGTVVRGEELGSDRVVVGGEAVRLTGSSRIGGFFLLEAPTLDEVRTLAEGHPHVAAGGVIEIAPVVRR